MTSVRSPAIQHAVAILLVGIVVVLARLPWPLVLHQQALIPVFLLTVTLTSWFWGGGPGLTAAAGSVLALGVLLSLQDELRASHLELLWAGSLFLMAVMVGLQRAARRRAETALVERDWRLRLVSDQIPGGLWSTDTELVVTSGFGAQSHLLHGQLGIALTNHFGDTEAGSEAIASHRRALRGQSCAYELEWGGRTFQCRVEPLRAPGGEIIGVVGVGSDITDRKAAEKERERLLSEVKLAKHQLEAVGKAKDHFLATLSHELRTPLTPVLALASALRGRTDLPEDVIDDLETIRRNAELERTLIDDLLDLTRVAAGKLQLHRETVDAHDLLRHTADVVREDVRHKGVNLVLELSADRHHLHGDAARLQQVFWNLLKNAVKFTPTGGTVSVRTMVNAGEVFRVEVVDTGIGIAAGALPHIFEPYEQGAETITRTFGGLGLGLHISKALIDAHGGRISACSEGKGRGATFAVEMPLTAVPSQPTGGEKPEPAEVSGLHILLVEDHADTARVMQRLLNGAGHRVDVACTVAAALQWFETASALDLLISDIGLPDGSGLDLMREVAAKYGVKGIALSGYGTEADVAECANAGLTAHLTKPVPMSALRRAIAEVSSAGRGQA